MGLEEKSVWVIVYRADYLVNFATPKMVGRCGCGEIGRRVRLRI